MIINRINSFPLIHNFKYTNSPMTTPIMCDTFVKTTSFKGAAEKDEQSFEEFEKWANETNFLGDVQEIVHKTGRILGSGYEGVVYEIPNNDKWVVKEFTRSNLVPVSLEKAQIIKLNHKFEDLNVGQIIAKIEIPSGKNYAEQFYILKKQKGTPIGVSFDSAGSTSDYSKALHINSLKKLANAPLSSFTDYIKNVKYITDKGFELDKANPHNFLFDEKTQSINFVDINDPLREKTNQYGDAIFPLIDGHFGINNISQSKEYLELTNKILEKYFTAMKNLGVKFNRSTHFDVLLQSQVLNDYLGAETLGDKIAKLKQMNLM